MNQLELIWELETYNSIIDECKVNLNELENSIQIINMIKRADELEININIIREKILNNSKLTSKLERLLKEYDYTKNKIEDDLYGGQISDIKLLEQLTVDKEKTTDLIDEVESRILSLIDDNEALEASYIAIKDDYKKLRIDLANIQEESNEMIKELKIKINNAELKKNDIIPNVEMKILKRYELTRDKRGKGIVRVSNDICGGCNVRIPTYLMQDIKTQSQIIYCESCGRLLYYIED